MGDLAPTARAGSLFSGLQSALDKPSKVTGSPAATVVAPDPAPRVERVSGTGAPADVSPGGAITPPGNEERYQAAMATYKAARKQWDANPWWKLNSDQRAVRNARSTAQIAEGPWTTDSHPPSYTGPSKPKRTEFGLPADEPVDTRTLVDAARARGYIKGPGEPGGLEVLPRGANAEQAAAFETRFLTAYARAAIDAKVPRKALLDVLAQEVGGNGRHNEMHPDSAALGFAQLLPANTIERLVENGEQMANRLRAKGLGAKADLVMRMRADVVTANGGVAPTEWPRQQEMGRTPLGYAVHAANLDPDIGAELHTTKLRVTARQFRDYSVQNGTPNRELTGPTLEAMNLAGPRNGYAMSHPANAAQLSLNFFGSSGYFGNAKLLSLDGSGRTPRTAGQVMTRMTEIMNGVHTQGATYRQLDTIYRKLAGEPPRTD